jgi:hypothetical protein
MKQSDMVLNDDVSNRQGTAVPKIADWQDVRPPIMRLVRESSVRRVSNMFEHHPKPLPIGRDRITFASTSWRILLGTVALLDFLATIIGRREALHDDAVVCPTRKHFFSASSNVSCAIPTKEDSRAQQLVFRHILYLLYDWAEAIGVLFSVLWFVDGFLKAQWKRNERILKIDKKRLLQGGRDLESEIGGAWGTYYRTIVIQLLFLPVSFFAFILEHVFSGKDLIKAQTNKEADFYSEYSTHCLLVALVQFAISVAQVVVGEHFHAQRKTISWRLVRSAIRRPIRAYSRVRLVLRTLRLFKYAAPLMGLTVKCLENSINVSKSIRQHWSVHLEYHRRKKKWRTMDGSERKLVASIRIQSAFRGMQTRKGVRSFMSTLQARKSMIAARMQRATQRSIVRGRTQLDLKKLEFEQLKREARHFRKSGVNMCADNRRRLYELQDEIQEAANELVNKRLLLRPNARFAVSWKIVFVLCVILDITQQAVHLKMMNQLHENEEALTVGELFEKTLPIPATKWAECAASVNSPSEARDKPERFFLLIRRVGAERATLPPWYCSEPVMLLQTAVVSMLRFISTKLVWFVAIVCYLDVVITFFIGELHPESGVLMPKSFFKRWVFPGLLLELMANPQMETTSRALGRAKDEIMHIGPLRFWRWTVTCFYPTFSFVAKNFEVRFCRPAIAKQNLDAIIDNNHIEDKGSRLMAISMLSIMKSQNDLLGNVRRRSILYDGP